MSISPELLALPEHQNPVEINEVSRLKEIVSSTKRIVGRCALALGLATGPAIAINVGEVIIAPTRAEASTFVDDYPNLGAMDYNPDDPNDYEWWVDENGNGRADVTSLETDDDESMSPRGYYYRNCTDGASYWTNKYTGVNPRGWGNAITWDDSAAKNPNYNVKPGNTNSIESGDIAQSDDSDGFGHVGFVTNVVKDTNGRITSIILAELNKAGTGDYSHDTYTAKNALGNFSRYSSGSADWDHFIDVNGAGKGLNNETITSSSASVTKPDFNLDNSSDLAWYQGNTIFLLGGKTDGSFANSGNTTGFGTPDWVGSGDTDKDGRSEVFWHQGNSLYDLVWNGSSWLIRNSTHGIGTPTKAISGDFNNDGISDIAWYQGSTLYLLAGKTAGNFVIAGNTSGFGTPNWIGAGDTDKDGRSEVFWHQGTTIYDLVWTGSSWGIRNSTTGIGAPSAATTGDFTLDGSSDIAWYQGSTIFTLAGNTAGKFAIAGNTSGFGAPDWVGSGDTDKDGRSEVFWHQGNTIFDLVWNGASWLIRNRTNNIGTPVKAIASQ